MPRNSQDAVNVQVPHLDISWRRKYQQRHCRVARAFAAIDIHLGNASRSPAVQGTLPHIAREDLNARNVKAKDWRVVQHYLHSIHASEEDLKRLIRIRPDELTALAALQYLRRCAIQTESGSQILTLNGESIPGNMVHEAGAVQWGRSRMRRCRCTRYGICRYCAESGMDDIRVKIARQDYSSQLCLRLSHVGHPYPLCAWVTRDVTSKVCCIHASVCKRIRHDVHLEGTAVLMSNS